MTVAVAGFAIAGSIGLAIHHAGSVRAHAPQRHSPTGRPLSVQPIPERNAAAAEVDEIVRQTRECERERAAMLAGPALPGAPGFEAVRAQLVARAKGEPLFFVQTPAYAATTDPEVIADRIRIDTSAHGWDTLAAFLVRARGRVRLARAVLLRDGYLYTEDPNLGFAFASQVGLENLFDEPHVWIQRGELLLHADRGHSGYVFTDGPNRGEAARLLLFDRTGVGTPDPALHRDLRALRYRMHFDAIRIERITEAKLLASVRYGSLTIPTILASDGPRLDPMCRIVDPGASAALGSAITEIRERQRVLAKLRAAIVTQIDERLPFDEPKTEVGQEDGTLRQSWRQAYLLGFKSFRYNGDRYHVFDGAGRPRVPQVCVDFLTDTFERASGTWWRAEPETPGRIDGNLDFDKLADLPRRRVEAFIAFAQRTPAWFDVHTTTPAERIELGYKKQFFDYLLSHSDSYQAGDIVVIRGMTPWDDEHMHYHSFFIYETDPVTGIPVAIAGNAGTPALWTWEAEARRTPHRSVWYRIRPRYEWLRTVVSASTSDDAAPVLARGGS